MVTEVALTGNPATPWVWVARPPPECRGYTIESLESVALSHCGSHTRIQAWWVPGRELASSGDFPWGANE